MVERPRRTRGLRHVALRSRQLLRLEHFYVDVLGYTVEWRPDPENVYLTNGEDSLALHADTTAAEETRVDHIGVLVDDINDVDGWAAYVAECGFAPDTEPTTHRDGCRSFYMRDP